MTSDEKRLRRLEEELQLLRKALESVNHKAGQAAEDQQRQFQNDSTGRTLMRAQSVGVITAASANVLGAGTARLLQVIVPPATGLPTRFRFVPDVQVSVVNDTGTATINNEYLIVAVVDGYYTCIVGDCATGSPTAAPTPP
jgi:hypothetical protein